MARAKASARKRPARYYPALLDLRGRLCLVVGGGAVAARKAQSVVRAGAEVTVVSPSFAAALRSMRYVRRVRRAFRASDLRGVTVAIAATDRPEVNERVARVAAERGILVNVVDQPGLCSFIVPAALSRGPLTIAISTAGVAPALAKRIRQQLEKLFPPQFAGYVKALGTIRQELKHSPLTPRERQRIAERLAMPQGYRLYCRGGQAALRRAAGVSQKR